MSATAVTFCHTNFELFNVNAVALFTKNLLILYLYRFYCRHTNYTTANSLIKIFGFEQQKQTPASNSRSHSNKNITNFINLI